MIYLWRCWFFANCGLFDVFVLEQKEQLKMLLGAKDREEGTRSPETVKVQLRSTLVSAGTHTGPDTGSKAFVSLLSKLL